MKSVEIYIKNILLETNFRKYVSFIHFGLTSQDINNVVYPVLIKKFIENEFFQENKLSKNFNSNRNFFISEDKEKKNFFLINYQEILNNHI